MRQARGNPGREENPERETAAPSCAGLCVLNGAGQGPGVHAWAGQRGPVAIHGSAGRRAGAGGVLLKGATVCQPLEWTDARPRCVVHELTVSRSRCCDSI